MPREGETPEEDESVAAAGPKARLGQAVREIVAVEARRLLESEVAAKRRDENGIHEMRRATRRLRAALRTFRPYMDVSWNRGLKEELRWLSGEVGAVRDVEVLRERLIPRADGDGDWSGVFRLLDARGARAEARLGEVFESARYGLLRGRLERVGESSWLDGDLDAECGRALGRRVDVMWRRVRRPAEVLREDSPDALYHAVRKRGKDLRWAVQALRPWLKRRERREAKRLDQALSKLVSVLGARQDSLMMRGLLSEYAGQASADVNARAAIEKWSAREDAAVAKLGRRARKLWASMERRDWRG